MGVPEVVRVRDAQEDQGAMRRDLRAKPKVSVRALQLQGIKHKQRNTEELIESLLSGSQNK